MIVCLHSTFIQELYERARRTLENGEACRHSAQRHVTPVGNSKGTLSAEHHRKPGTETREQARRINNLALASVTAGWRFNAFVRVANPSSAWEQLKEPKPFLTAPTYWVLLRLPRKSLTILSLQISQGSVVGLPSVLLKFGPE